MIFLTNIRLKNSITILFLLLTISTTMLPYAHAQENMPPEAINKVYYMNYLQSYIDEVMKAIEPYIEKAISNPIRPDTSQLSKAVEVLVTQHKNDLRVILKTLSLMLAHEQQARGFHEQARQYLEYASKISDLDIYALASYIVHLEYNYRLHDVLQRITSNKKEIQVVYLNMHTFKVETGNLDNTRSTSQKTNVVVYGLSLPLPGATIYFAQEAVDIIGGQGMDDAGFYYNVDGDNKLFKVYVYDLSDYSQSFYYYVLELWFYDEDHPDPVTNNIYDLIRLMRYGRIEDVEKIAVYSYQGYTWTVDFGYGDICSFKYTYARPLGVHGSCKQTLSGSITIYTSNVWNHAMNTFDTNRRLVTVYVSPSIVWV